MAKDPTVLQCLVCVLCCDEHQSWIVQLPTCVNWSILPLPPPLLLSFPPLFPLFLFLLPSFFSPSLSPSSSSPSSPSHYPSITFSLLGTSTTLVELYLSTQGGQELRTSLVKEHVLPPDTPLYPHWAKVLPKMIDMVLRQLYPVTVYRVCIAQVQST